MSGEHDDDSLVVAASYDAPGGWLPIGEYGKLYAELEATRARMRRLAGMMAWARALWFSAGIAVGALLAALWGWAAG